MDLPWDGLGPRDRESPWTDARWFGAALAAVTVLAFLLRWIHNDVAVLHFNFDEAEYALRARYIVEHGGAYPVEKLFDHPPLWPYTLAGTFALLGTSWWSARLAAALAGTLTVPVLVYAGFQWKGRWTGLLAGALAAVLPLLVRVSRQALIEPLLGFFVAILCAGIARPGGTRSRRTYALFAVGGAGALLAKETAVLVGPGVLAYAVWSGFTEDEEAWMWALGALVLVVPVYAGMVAAGFPEIHLARSGGDVTYGAGGRTITPGPGASLPYLVPFVNILLVPLVISLAWVTKRRGGRGLAYSIIVGTVFLFLVSSPLRGLHYLYLLGPPTVLLSAVVLRRSRTAAGVVFVILLVISLQGVSGAWSEDMLHEAHMYVGETADPGDSVLSGEHPVFEWYYPSLETLGPTPTNLETGPDYLVLNLADVDALSEEAAFDEYDLVRVVENEGGEPWYRIYRHESHKDA